MRNSRHTARRLAPSSTANATNCLRKDTLVASCHGMTALLPPGLSCLGFQVSTMSPYSCPLSSGHTHVGEGRGRGAPLIPPRRGEEPVEVVQTAQPRLGSPLTLPSPTCVWPEDSGQLYGDI